MPHDVIVPSRFSVQYLARLMDGLPEEQMDAVPVDRLHSTRWILCHLAATGDHGLRLLGLPTLCPRNWIVAYGPGSDGVTHPDIKPPKDEVLAKIKEVYGALCEGLESASPDLLAEPHGLAMLQQTCLQTKGHLISHLLTTHFASHLGQLSAIRRSMGLAHLL